MGRTCQATGAAASLGTVLSTLLLLLLLLPLLPPVEAESQEVVVAGFMDNDAVLYKNISVTSSSSLGLCGLVRLEAVQVARVPILMTLKTSSLIIVARMDNFKVWVSVDGVSHSVQLALEDSRWTRLCLGFRFSQNDITNRTTASEHNQDDTSTHTTASPPTQNPVLDVWIVLGEKFVNVTRMEHLSWPLSGYVQWNYSFGDKSLAAADGNSFVGSVLAFEIQTNITKLLLRDLICSKYPSGSYYIESFSYSRKGNIFFYLQDKDLMCSEEVHEVTLLGPHGYKGFKKMCSSLGGHLARVSEVVAKEVGNESCVTDEGFVSWLRLRNLKGDIVSATCRALLLNGTTDKRPCVQDLPCSRCRVPVALRYLLYGPVEDFDRKYLLKMHHKKGIYFEGSHTSRISLKDKGWTLWSPLHHRWWRLEHDAWPLGRHHWYSQHLNVTLTFTSCNFIQFPVDDGTCILRSQRCDSYQDLPDESDELDCSDRRISKTHEYDKSTNPFQKSTDAMVNTKFIIKNIDEISAAKGMATMYLVGRFSWKDHRLKLVDLKLGKQNFPCEEVWTPRLQMYSGNKFGLQANTSYITKVCSVTSRFRVEEVNMDDPLAGWVSSSGVDVNMVVEMQVSWDCRLKLYRYPFGRHTCSLVLKTSSAKKKKRWDHEEDYDRDRDLLDFHLEKVILSHRNATLRITLHLLGKADYHLLSSFSPSGLMFLICYSTLHYPVGFYNERLMASLTSLLVLVGLFSQATITNVKTSYFKLIDIWYVVLIALCFLIVISNPIIYSLHQHGKDTHEDEAASGRRCVPRRAVLCNAVCKVILFSAFVSLITVYVLVAWEYL